MRLNCNGYTCREPLFHQRVTKNLNWGDFSPQCYGFPLFHWPDAWTPNYWANMIDFSHFCIAWVCTAAGVNWSARTLQASKLRCTNTKKNAYIHIYTNTSTKTKTNTHAKCLLGIEQQAKKHMNNVHHDHNSAYWNLNDEENHVEGKKIGKVWGPASLRGGWGIRHVKPFTELHSAPLYSTSLNYSCTAPLNRTELTTSAELFWTWKEGVIWQPKCTVIHWALSRVAHMNCINCTALWYNTVHTIVLWQGVAKGHVNPLNWEL